MIPPKSPKELLRRKEILDRAAKTVVDRMQGKPQEISISDLQMLTDQIAETR